MLIKILIASILILFLSNSISAIDLMPEPKLCNKLFSADLVIYTKVLKVEDIKHEDDPEEAPDQKYSLDIIKVYRGECGKKLVVISEMGKHNVQLEIGKEYILFPSKFSDGTYQIWTDLGEVGGGLVYSKQWDIKIEKLLHEKIAIIEGEVVVRDRKSYPDLILTVTGNSISQKVNVDNNGYFYAEVKPGTYKIDIPKNLYVTINSPDGLSPDPKNDGVVPQTLVGGQCVQIQLMERQ
jgi:hypothetical protein